MSKNLVKILSICAISILLLLTVVGISLCCTETGKCTLTIEECGVAGQYASSDIKIRVEGEDQEGTTIRLKKNTDVSVVFSGEGYVFKGWFTGKGDEIKPEDKAISSNPAYSFTLRGDTTLTAVRDVIKYTITYSGFLDDGKTSVGTQISNLSQTGVEYGAPLATLSSSNAVVHEGWIYGTGAEIYTKATFAETQVEIKPIWSNQMVITYMADEEIIAINTVSETQATSYVLPNATSDIVKENLTAGYEFNGWKNSAGNTVSSITFDKNGIVLYLKEKLITYTLNVKFHAVSEDASKNTTITYNAENGFSLCEYAGEDARFFYVFKGLALGDTTYEVKQDDYVSGSERLSDVVKNQTSKTLNVTAVWECQFPAIYFNYIAYADYVYAPGEEVGGWTIYGDKAGKSSLIQGDDMPVFFEDSNEEDCYCLEDNFYDLIIGSYEKLYAKDESGKKYNVKFAGTVTLIVNNGPQVIYNTSEQGITFVRMIDSTEKYFSKTSSTEITVAFKFEKLDTTIA